MRLTNTVMHIKRRHCMDEKRKPMRHPEPDFVTAYLRREVPKCCHLCFKYGEDGICTEFHSSPPQEFAHTIGACSKWESYDQVPF